MLSSILTYTNSECISISAFPSLVGIPLGVTSSVVGLKTSLITAETKK